MRQNETSAIQFGRDICGNFEAATAREWLVTNGLGGYASGTVAGVATRRYHGLLIAAMPAPLGRMMMLNHLSEQLRLADADRRVSDGGDVAERVGQPDRVLPGADRPRER